MKIGDTWVGEPPERCDLCGGKLANSFVDGRTSDGRWAIMCPWCRIYNGPIRLGAGLGQRFTRTKLDIRWRKAAG
jgi:hypothetical protein